MKSLALATWIALCPSAFAQCREDIILLPELIQAGDNFGLSVALSGDMAVVGAPHYSPDGVGLTGRVLVFESFDSMWREVASLVGSNVQPTNLFGHAVAADEGRLLASVGFESSVYVFERQTDGSYLETAILEDPSVPFGLGGAVDIEGEWAFATSGINLGVLSVFRHVNGNWIHWQTVTSSATVRNQAWGGCVAASGNTVMVSAHHAVPTGEVYVFERTGPWWVEKEVLYSGDTETDSFGWDIDVDGATAVIGAYIGEESAAYVYERGPSGWTQSQKLMAEDGSTNTAFGRSVGVSGDLITVGAPAFKVGNTYAGAVYWYEREGGAWQQFERHVYEDAINSYQLGDDLDLDGYSVIVGAQGPGVGIEVGRAHILSGHLAYSTAYCRCDESLSPPCGNTDPLEGCRNSTGQGASLEACGSASVSSDDLQLGVSQVPANTFGVVFMGDATNQFPFGAGILCVSSGSLGVFRFPVRSTGIGGAISEGPGLASYSQTNFPSAGHITAGNSWNFQAWYRDPAGPCSYFNLSDALTIHFVP